MDSIQKLVSDIEKVKKHYRAEHNNNYDGEKVCEQIADLFARTNRNLSSLAQSFADYWLDTYVRASMNIQDEPSDDNINRIAAMQAILDGKTEYTDILTTDDWHSLCDAVNAEAEDIPIETLNDLMALFLDKKAF
ncbi:MAG: hypothetical protein IJ828_09195 [Treponema sp.]|nr:hypothetical protein [Treponema sp.]